MACFAHQGHVSFRSVPSAGSAPGKEAGFIAVAHSLLGIACGLLRQQRDYRELGGDYFDRLNAEEPKRHLLRRLARLGYRATLEPADSVA